MKNNVIYIFVGGLARSKTVKESMQAAFDRVNAKNNEIIENCQFLPTTNPQVTIVKGIPIQKINISQRNFNKVYDRNLYVLYTLNERQLALKDETYKGLDNHSMVYIKGQDEEQFNKAYNCLYSKGKFMYCPELLFKKDITKNPDNEYTITELLLFLDVNVNLVFYKSKSDKQPPFFNISIQQQEARFNDKTNNLCGEQLYLAILRVNEADLSEEDKIKLSLNKQLGSGTGKFVKASICFFLGHERFHPDPKIRIYGNYLDNQNMPQQIKLKDIPIEDWYTQDVKREVDMEFQIVQNKVKDVKKHK